MSSSRLHPRRTPASPSVDDLSESLRSVSLRKGTTFHSPNTKDSELINPFFKDTNIPSLPSRSVTCPKALEDLLLGAGERRAADLLKRVDDAIAKRTELSSILSEPEVLPIPRFVVEQAAVSQGLSTIQEQDDDQSTTAHQRADSGIGSSISESTSEKLHNLRSGTYSPRILKSLNNTLSTASGTSTLTSAVTRSFAAHDTNAGLHGLSEFAQQQVQKFIVKPILDEPALKDFHPLIQEVPARIGSKDIITLRDLEKTLIFLAPVSSSVDQLDRAIAYWSVFIQDYSRSPAAYRSFCEASIRCLHLTVDGVHESDQCLPADRPYSTGYFIDLVEQIRRYAAILAATREKQQRGEELDEMDATPYVEYSRNTSSQSYLATNFDANMPCRSDRIELQAGVTHSGKPGFLTRTKDDSKHISLATEQLLSSEDVAASSAKRPMEVTADDDGARRSMARRKKGAPILTYTCDADGCRKQFKRPCDLTKHVRTHDRPFKCPDDTCKYHKQGWPTEKERDRHYNDKHSDKPSLYRCLYPDCPYTSKRESNCKQHMEKSHGWEYVRSKNNGKGPVKATVTRIPQAPTPSNSAGSGSASESSTPPTSTQPSPYMDTSLDMARSASVESTNQFICSSNPPMFDFGQDFTSHFNTEFLDTSMSGLFTPAWSEQKYVSADTSPYSELDPTGNTFGSSENFQQPTPSPNFNAQYSHAHPDVTALSSIHAPAFDFSPHITHGAHDMTLTTNRYLGDNMQIDEGFGDAFAADGDFQLFEGGVIIDRPLSSDQAGLGNMGSQFDSNFQTDNFDVNSLFPELQNQH